MRSPTTRRGFLAAAAAGSAASLAGCAGLANDGPAAGTDDSTEWRYPA
jgi:hypothetical protein